MDDLLQQFSTAEGYELYPDVLPFFQWLRQERFTMFHRATERIDTVVGIISNSDDRIGLVLQSLGLCASSRRFSQGIEREVLIKKDANDFDFLALSYDVGVTKPDRQIFDAAKLCAALPDAEPNVEHVYLHVGNDPVEDYQAAKQAGWKSVSLVGHKRSIRRIPNGSQELLLSDLSALRLYIRNHIFGREHGFKRLDLRQ